ncbi:WD repeat-containing protein 43-like [Haliotis rufescens]|uniref:WD repeat-containing protein 43-like n=1 Tax=Haliotis rufescens TaxID=6454 RepID=UPI00201F6CF0|nr:WD repeat-containing protein 43-like [Haliotis rufescens]
MAGYPLDFSQNGEILVYSSPDGVLKLWDSSTGQLNKEYTPSSHLSATCSCLSWGPGRHLSGTPKRKRRKKSSGGMEEIGDLDLIAIGTTNGNILLYSVAKGDIHTQFEEGHTDTVNGTCWHPEAPTLYSCSSDHNVIEWDVVTGKVKQKWKADKGSVYSVCMCSHSHLLTAGRSIKLWEIHTRQVLKSFTGHATEVFRLISVPLIGETPPNPNSAEHSYFLSAARSDRVINAWQIDTSSKDKNALASFSLPDEPVYVNISKSSKDQSILLAVVTKSGQVLVFEHTLNGRLKKPLRPKVKIQVVTAGGGVKEDTPRPIPVLAAHIQGGKEKSLLLAHGSYLKPTFEKVAYDPSQPEVCLIREDPLRTAFKKDGGVSKIRTPSISKEATVLVPANMVPKDPSLSADKRRKRQNSVGELTMEERLHAISLDKSDTRGGATAPPTAESVVHLLTQALQSKDKKLLSTVLHRSSEKVIQKTIRKLPIVCVLPLVHELSKRMEGHPQSASKSVKWLKTVMAVHTSYLMTFPEIVDKLSSLYQMMDARVSMFTKLSRLQGKLDLVLTQITSHDQEDEEDAGKSQQPLLLYQDESSDEDFPMEDILPSGSGEDWDDLSEMSSDEVEANGKKEDEGVESEEEDDDDSGEEEEEEEDMG